MSKGDGKPLDEDADPAKRLQSYVDKLPDILESFEDSHPEWQAGIMLTILDWALKRLKSYIEEASEDEISLENPFVELRFPLTCERHSAIDDNGEWFTVNSGKLTDSQFQSDESATKAMVELMIRHLEIVLLQDLTENAALIGNGETFRGAIPDDVAASLLEIEDKDSREKAFRNLFLPCSFGAGTVDYGDELEEETPISQDAVDQIERIRDPLIAIPMHVDGNPIRLITIFEVHPLVINPDTLEGHFPIVVGLGIQSASDDPVTEDWFEQPWTSLKNWPQDSLDEVWSTLEGMIDAALSEVGFRSEPEIEEAFISITATIKVSAAKGRVDGKFEEVLNSLKSIGQIEKFQIEACQRFSVELDHIVHWQQLLDELNRAESNQEKGNALESLMEALFSSVPGFEIVSNVRTETEEIDLWIENGSDHPVLNKEGSEILVECKNWQSKCGKNEFVVFREKMINRAGRCSLGFLVSWNGFAETIDKEMLRSSKEKILIALLDGGMIQDAVRTGDFLPVILKSRRSSLAT